MRKSMHTIIAAIALLACAATVQAQRMIPGGKGVELNAGTLSDKRLGSNYYVNVGMTINGKNGNYQLWALEYAYEHASYKHLKIPLDTYTAEGGYSLYLLGDAWKNIALNAALTAVVGYENVNRGQTLLYDGGQILNSSGFIYGAGGRLSLEIYLSDRFVFLIQGRTKVLWGTTLERFRPSAGLGLRFNL